MHAVAEGGAYLSPQVARQVIAQFGGGRAAREAAAAERLAGLTERERDVLALVGAGLSNADIAERLFLVEGTVKSYVSAILNRLGMKNRVQAAILAHEAGLAGEAAS